MDPYREYDCMLKLVLLGDYDVGKKNFISQFVYDDEDAHRKIISGIGVDFEMKTITVDGKRVKLQIWDAPGQERYQSMIIPYFRGASGIALFYDITKERTFSNIPKWLYTISEYASYDVQIALVGNRVRLETERQVSEERGRKLASNYDILFFESSSYTNVNVAEVFEALTTKILEYRSMMPPMELVKGDTTKKTISDDIIRLDHDKGKRSAANVRINNGCCC